MLQELVISMQGTIWCRALERFQAWQHGCTGKKWFMRPSLKADSGDIVGKPFSFSTTRYEKIRHVATLSMRMETAAILTLRKVLNPELPAHQAIINASTAAMRADQAGELPLKYRDQEPQSDQA